MKYPNEIKELIEHGVPVERRVEFDNIRMASIANKFSYAFPAPDEAKLFFGMFGLLPNSFRFGTTNCSDAMVDFLKEYSTEIINLIHHSVNAPGVAGLVKYETANFFLKDNILLNFADDEDTVTLLYNGSSPAKILALQELISKHLIKPSFKPEIHLIVKSLGGLDLVPYTLKDQETDINLNYNDDFKTIHETILQRLQTPKDKGLVVLHGKPGTGKTSYIKMLLGKIKKHVVIMPPDMASELASPSLLSLLRQFKNSILIIEDAEQIVVSREISKHSPVSAILNMTDGILSELLNIQIVCTFNTDISRIDSALLRKGRLIAKYEFKELEVPKARALSQKLGLDFQPKKPMNLTEIYNLKDDNFESERRSVGF